MPYENRNRSIPCQVMRFGERAIMNDGTRIAYRDDMIGPVSSKPLAFFTIVFADKSGAEVNSRFMWSCRS